MPMKSRSRSGWLFKTNARTPAYDRGVAGSWMDMEGQRVLRPHLTGTLVSLLSSVRCRSLTVLGTANNVAFLCFPRILCTMTNKS
jgi:hypothetical protein